ncbi:alpha/beta-hydrolase [Mycena latifolia]|nr:alpha/beta-hydrolase [Mycena latifolia]
MRLHYSFVLLAFTLFPTALGVAGPVVHTSSGSYVGDVGVHDAQSEVDAFKVGLQTAGVFGADCPQLPTILAIDGVPTGPPLRGANQSEDCFFANVWRPSGISAKTKLPILVYIHGGGYFAGAGSEWDGTSFVRRSVATKKPIIYITFNYRLGVLGFIGSAQVPPSDLNVGLQDQRDALGWIQDNAEAFGGDGSRITISGESAGASSVHIHYLYPDSRSSFRAGISSSGSSLVPNTPACDWHDRPGGGYTLLGNVTGCGTGAGSFECLQNMPFDTFWPLALTTYEVPGGGFPPWSVACKGPAGSLIEEFPVKKVIDGDFLNLPIITGTNRNEGNLIGTSFLDITPQSPIDLENSILSAFMAGQATKNVSDDTLAKLLDLYAHPTDSLSNSSLFNRAAQFATDYEALTPQRLFHKTASAEERNQDMWAYSFQQHLDGAPDFLGPVPTQKLVSQMQDFYISFVNDLTPGPFWPQYTEASKGVMRLLDGQVGPIADTLRRTQTDSLNQVDVMEGFGRFG